MEYQRFVAYVYEYIGRKKGKNCGYIKVAAKGNVCSVDLRLQCPGLPQEEECRLYGFVRKSGLINGILLGNCKGRGQRAECSLQTDTAHMGGSAFSLRELGGMVVVTEHGSFFGTEWDDQPIHPENFRIMTEQEAKKQEAMQEQVQEKPEPAAEKEAATKKEAATEKEADTGKEAVTENAPEAGGKAPAGLSEAGGKTPAGVPAAGGKAPAGSPAADGELEAEEIREPQKRPERELERAAGPAPDFMPFGDGELEYAWKIQPRDLIHLSGRERAFAQNRFLLFGYYQFGHLMVGKKRNGQYILGVPGRYDQQERFMANMFGFPYFKESRDLEAPGQRRGGYWYRLINTPDFYK